MIIAPTYMLFRIDLDTKERFCHFLNKKNEYDPIIQQVIQGEIIIKKMDTKTIPYRIATYSPKKEASRPFKLGWRSAHKPEIQQYENLIKTQEEEAKDHKRFIQALVEHQARLTPPKEEPEPPQFEISSEIVLDKESSKRILKLWKNRNSPLHLRMKPPLTNHSI